MKRRKNGIEIFYKSVFVLYALCSCVNDDRLISGVDVCEGELYVCFDARCFRARGFGICFCDKFEDGIGKSEFIGKKLSYIVSYRSVISSSGRETVFGNVIHKVRKTFARKAEEFLKGRKVNSFFRFEKGSFDSFDRKVSVGDYGSCKVKAVFENVSHIDISDIFDVGFAGYEKSRHEVGVNRFGRSDGKFEFAVGALDIYISSYVGDCFSCGFKRRSAQIEIFESDIERNVYGVSGGRTELKRGFRKFSAEDIDVVYIFARNFESSVIYVAYRGEASERRDLVGDLSDIAVFVDDFGYGIERNAAVENCVDSRLEMDFLIPENFAVNSDIVEICVDKDVCDVGNDCFIGNTGNVFRRNSENDGDVSVFVFKRNKGSHKALYAVFCIGKTVVGDSLIEFIYEIDNTVSVEVDIFACYREGASDFSEESVKGGDVGDNIGGRSYTFASYYIYVFVIGGLAERKIYLHLASVGVDILVCLAVDFNGVADRRPSINDRHIFGNRVVCSGESSFNGKRIVRFVYGIARFKRGYKRFEFRSSVFAYCSVGCKAAAAFC